MTLEEKKAIQTVLLDELAQQQEAQPTLLVDALLSGQGHQFVYMTISKRLGMATNLGQMFTHLLKALNVDSGRQEDAA